MESPTRRAAEIRTFRFAPIDDDEQPTRAAEPVFLIREVPAPDPLEEATSAARLRFAYGEINASTEVPSKHAPQLLDAVVFGGGTLGIVSGPMLLMEWAPASVSTGAIVVTSGMEVAAILIGMVLYRLRRR